MTQVNIRIREDDLEIIKRAAEIEQRSFSSFMISVAKTSAEKVIDQHGRTTLGGIEWNKFAQRLDQKPKKLENLVTLLKKKPVWEK